MQVAPVQLALQGELRGRGLTRGGVTYLGHCWWDLFSSSSSPGCPEWDGIQVPSPAVGTGDWELLPVPGAGHARGNTSLFFTSM